MLLLEMMELVVKGFFNQSVSRDCSPLLSDGGRGVSFLWHDRLQLTFTHYVPAAADDLAALVPCRQVNEIHQSETE